MEKAEIEKRWDSFARVVDNEDPMREIRYAMGLRYLRYCSRNIRILEVGCGEGTGLLMLKSLGFSNLCGVEVSTERIRFAQRKLNGQVEIRKIGLDSRLPFSEACFDVVCSFAVIEHTLSPADFISEIHKVLKPGGWAIISSDCCTWRILQILRIHRSAQPIERIMFPLKLIRLFKGHNFKIMHLDTFNLPSRGNIYLWFLKKAVKEFLVKSFEINRKKSDSYVEYLNSSIDFPPGYNTLKILRNYLDDENIFFPKK